MIRGELRRGGLHRIFPGVYALGHRRVGNRGRMFAGTLACGEAALISHRSAAWLLGLLDKAPVTVELVVSGARGRQIDGLHAHRTGPLRLDETGTCDGIPCTSPARTLVDLAGVVGMRTLRSCFERAAAKRLLNLDAVEASMRPGRRGMPTLRKLVAEWRRALPPSSTQPRLKSPLEAKVLPLIMRREVPAPLSNAPVQLLGGQRIEVDFLWAEQRFVLEADSRGFHATDVASERDRWRDRELLRVGFSSLRVTWLQAESEPEEIADAVFHKLSTS